MHSRYWHYWGLIADLLLTVVCAAVVGAVQGQPWQVAGIFSTSWPLLVGCLVGWLVIRIWMRRWPVWKSGFVVCADTLLVGVLLRLISGETAEWPFIAMTAIVLIALLVGWRTVWWFAKGKQIDAERREERRRRRADAVTGADEIPALRQDQSTPATSNPGRR